MGPHSTGYRRGTEVLDDAIGHLAWQIKHKQGESVPPNVTGALGAYRVVLQAPFTNRVRVSAAAIYARGAPTSKFEWDFTSDGRPDFTSGQAWLDHDYGLQIPFGGASVVETTVRITHADGDTVTTRKICVRRSNVGAVTGTCPG